MNVFSGKAISITIVFVSYCLFAHAQFNDPKHELGITAGMFIYQGDLTPETAGAFKSPGVAVNLFYNRLLSPSFSLRTNLAFGKLNADETNVRTLHGANNALWLLPRELLNYLNYWCGMCWPTIMATGIKFRHTFLVA